MQRRTSGSHGRKISRGVNFGWGMVAHIYPGGKLKLDQTNAGGAGGSSPTFRGAQCARADGEDVNIRSSA